MDKVSPQNRNQAKVNLIHGTKLSDLIVPKMPGANPTTFEFTTTTPAL
jgi:hypothetical protein